MKNNNNISYTSSFSDELREATSLYKRHQDINKLSALEYYYQLNSNDYLDCSEKALLKCIQQRIDFTSTPTSINHIFDKYITIKCPECDMPMDYYSGTFECGFCKIVISLDLNSIHFNFFQPYWDRLETSKPYLNSNNNIEIQIKGFRNNSSKGELLAKIIKHITSDSSIQVKIAYEWIVQNKLIKQTIEECVERIDSIDINTFIP